MLARRRLPKLRSCDPQTVFQKHRRFVRGRVCIVPGCEGKPQFCHVRAGLPANTPSYARPGTSKLPHDAFGFPACFDHHIRDQHQNGERAFELKHGVNLLKEALDLARNSPCEEVRRFVRTILADLGEKETGRE